MNEIMKDNTPKNEEYVKLVLYRDSLIKECEDLEVWYYGVFGELMEKHYSLLVECAELKKRIAYCQARDNRGLAVSRKDLDKFIHREMKEYYENLKHIKDEVAFAKDAQGIHPIAVAKIKEIYRKIAKKIHPDIRPELYYENEDIQKAWANLVNAYECNDYHAIVKIEIQVNKLLEKYGIELIDVDLPNIDEMIEDIQSEIDSLELSPVFAYKDLQEDETAIDIKKQELKNEIEHFKEYRIALKKQLESYNIED